MGNVGGTGAVTVRVPRDRAAEVLAGVEPLLGAGCSVVVALDPRHQVDVNTVGGLARLALTARRRGAALVVHDPDWALGDLAERMGLSDVLGLGPRRAGPQPADPDLPDPDPTSGQPQR